MQLYENTRIIADDENQYRRVGVTTGNGAAKVKALGDLSMEVAEGGLAGRRIEAFAWLEHLGDIGESHAKPWDHKINVTEKRTGRRLVSMPLLAAGTQQPLDLTHDFVAAMTPSVLKGAAHAAFERFRKADEARLAELFAYLDSVPSLPPEDNDDA